MLRTLRLLIVPGGFAAVVAGCSGQADGPAAPPPAAAPPTALAPADGDHGHKPSAHGGIVVPIGRDNYHGEAVFEKDGGLRFYTLGQDEATVIEVEAQPLTAYARPEGGAEAVPFALRPEPQPGDAAGKTSQFVGTLPRELWGKRVEVTIPAVRINGERFRVGFTSAPAAGHGGPAMPGKVADAEERELYLTPGGRYTAADIAANGGVVASARFKGVPTTHDLKPQPGDPLCPVTLTKANPAFAWTVGGQRYLFCCPPCVDEFVRLAKEKPDEVRPPGEYRKQ
jgi:YHS domain-containing protein